MTASYPLQRQEHLLPFTTHVGGNEAGNLESRKSYTTTSDMKINSRRITEWLAAEKLLMASQDFEKSSRDFTHSLQRTSMAKGGPAMVKIVKKQKLITKLIRERRSYVF